MIYDQLYHGERVPRGGLHVLQLTGEVLLDFNVKWGEPEDQSTVPEINCHGWWNSGPFSPLPCSTPHRGFLVALVGAYMT